MKFVKKPVIVEAEQWFPGKQVEGVYGCPGQEMCPCYKLGGNHNKPHVMTAHYQIVLVEPGDWIIKEPNGNGYYPCKNDIFVTLYDKVPDLSTGASATSKVGL